MDFAIWMQAERGQRKLDVRSFARLAGVDASTISRLENARSQVTFSTVVRICEGIGVSPAELFRALQGKQLNQRNKHRVEQRESLFTLEDVEAFLSFLRLHWQEGCFWLTTLLNRIVLHESTAQQRSGKKLFVVEDIEKLLLDSELYVFEVQYPREMAAEDIWSMYLRNDVLTLADIGAYIKKARQKKQITLTTLEKSQALSASMVSRMETGMLERVKLVDVLLLDEHLEEEGRIVAMYWRVCRLLDIVAHAHEQGWQQPGKEFPVFLSQREQELKVIELFVTICRWLSCVYRTDHFWVREIREKLDHLRSERRTILEEDVKGDVVRNSAL